jgi:hypothetical protein
MRLAIAQRLFREPLAALLLGALLVAAPVEAQGGRGGRGGGPGAQDTTGAGGAPSLGVLMQRAAEDSDLRVAVRRYEQDLNVLRQRYDVPLSPVRIAREREFHNGWSRQLDSLSASGLNAAGRAEHATLRTTITANLAELETQERRVQAMAPLLTFVRPLQVLQENRRDRLDVDAVRAAQIVEDARKEVLRLTGAVAGARARNAEEFRSVTLATAGEAVEYIGAIRGVLESWYDYYYGFDPLFTWWVRMPYEEMDAALETYAAALRQEWAQ